MTPLLKRIRLDFDASEDQKGPLDRDRKRGPPHPLGFRCIRRHGSFSSMYSCPLFARDFRGGEISDRSAWISMHPWTRLVSELVLMAPPEWQLSEIPG